VPVHGNDSGEGLQETCEEEKIVVVIALFLFVEVAVVVAVAKDE